MTVTYPKIETLFDRNPDFSINTARFRRAEFDLIDRWVFTEKIDGTNIRLAFSWADTDSRDRVIFQVLGKTDNAQIPPQLLGSLQETCIRIQDTAAETMTRFSLAEYTLFGEGYGPKIQSGGRYRTTSQDQGFVLFDVNASGAWLDEEQVTETAALYQLERVPTVADGATVSEVIELVRGGFASDHAQAFDSTFLAEGIVAKTSVPLYDRRGERVVWKLKQRDFGAGKR